MRQDFVGLEAKPVTLDDDARLGQRAPGWTGAPWPEFDEITGQVGRLERLRVDHAPGLFAAMDGAPQNWDYLTTPPFEDLDSYSAWIEAQAALGDPRFYAIRDLAHDREVGVASLMRIDPEHGSIEVGNINLSPQLQGMRGATEALTLLSRWGFEAGYRRFEWKCNALNTASRRAAQRFGLSYEGVFRQAAVIKGRNRDTAWFAAIDAEWPALREAFQAWLSPSNFDAEGRQVERLSDLTALVRVAQDPALGPS